MKIRKSRSSLATLARRPHFQHGLIFLTAQSIVKMVGSITPKRISKKFLELNSCNFIVWLHSMICFIKTLSTPFDYKHYQLRKNYPLKKLLFLLVTNKAWKRKSDVWPNKYIISFTNIFNICVSAKKKSNHHMIYQLSSLWISTF